jgi:hypothetical protein
MQTLLMHYFHLPTLPREFSRHIHSEQELLSFLSETAAQWPKGRPCLMLSPNHGFLFCPDWLGAARSSERNKRFLTTLSIGEGQADFLQERFSLRIPEDRRPLFFYGCRQAPVYETIASLRQSLVQGVLAAKDIQESAVDGFLYESLPLFTQEEAHTALQRISETLSARFGVRIELTPEFSAPFFTPLELVEHLKAALFASGAEVFSPIDWEQEIVSIAREELFLYPQPLRFGDTNWSEWCFGFIQNLASGRLELWRLSRTAQRGEPMAAWNSFFREGKTWSILPP